MVMVKELLEDPHIQPGMMRSALSAVTSLFMPNKLTQLTANTDTVVPNKMPVGPPPNVTVTTDINK